MSATEPQTKIFRPMPKSRMEQLQDKMDTVLDKLISGDMTPEQGKVINSIFQTSINSARAEIEFFKATGRELSGSSFEPKLDALVAVNPDGSHLIQQSTGEHNNGITHITKHIAR